MTSCCVVGCWNLRRAGGGRRPHQPPFCAHPAHARRVWHRIELATLRSELLVVASVAALLRSYHAPRDALAPASAALRCVGVPRAGVRSRASAVVDPNGAPAADTKPEGVHGSGFRFMPMVSMQPEPSPALLAIAGAYPGITADPLLSPVAYRSQTRGGGTTTGSRATRADGLRRGAGRAEAALLAEHVAVVATPGRSASTCRSSTRCSRADRPQRRGGERRPARPRGQCLLRVRRRERRRDHPLGRALPPGWRVLGKLLYTILPNFKRIGKKDGFAELDDDFEF